MPHRTHPKGEHRRGKVGVPAAPVAHHARARQAEALGNLGCADQVVDFDWLAHGPDSTSRPQLKPLRRIRRSAYRPLLVVHAIALCTFDHLPTRSA